MFYCQQVNSGQGRRQEANYSLHGHEPIPHAAFVAVHVQVNSTLLLKNYKDMDKMNVIFQDIFQVAQKKLTGIKLQVNPTPSPSNHSTSRFFSRSILLLKVCNLFYAHCVMPLRSYPYNFDGKYFFKSYHQATYLDRGPS